MMQQTGAPIALTKYCLARCCKQLNNADLLRCARYNICTGVDEMTVPERLYEALGNHYGGDTYDLIKASLLHSDACEDMLKDPVVEAVFQELDPDDKKEFKDIGDAIKKKEDKDDTCCTEVHST